MDSEGFLRLADMVESYWGVHLYARIVENASEPKTDWYYVSVPRRFLSEEKDSLLTILLHEWGHRTISPRTIRESLLWQGIMASEGVGNPVDLLNVICDIHVDNYYLNRSNRWSRIYETGTRRHLELMADNLGSLIENGLGNTLEVQRQALLYDLECLALTHNLGLDHTPILPVTSELWATIMDSDTPEETRIQKAAGLVRYLYPETGKTGSRQASVPVPAGFWGGASFGEPTSADVLNLLNDLERVGIEISPLSASTFLGPEKASHLSETRRIRKAYEALRRVLPQISGTHGLGPADRSSTTIWRWGNPLQDIDWVATISTSGFSIPGVTTLRRKVEPGKVFSAPFAHHTVNILLDDSGSMWGSKIEAAVNTASGLIEAAHRWNDRVSLTVFDSDVDFVPPGREYSFLQKRILRCAGSGTGTLLIPALDRLQRTMPSTHRTLTCIITDGDIADTDSPALQTALTRLTTHGQVVIFAIGTDVVLHEWMQMPKIHVECLYSTRDGAGNSLLAAAHRRGVLI